MNADDRAAEVERLIGLGATLVHEMHEYGMVWTTLADPEGNEFCVATH
jgi:predicted enzyme related to lactoylglutathione lyase